MPHWLRWLLISATYTHAGFTYSLCWVRQQLLLSCVISSTTKKPSPWNLFFSLTLFYYLSFSLPFYSICSHLHPPSFSLLWLSPQFLSLCCNALFLIYHSSLPHFTPSLVLLPPHLPKAPLPVSHYIHSLVSHLLPLHISSSLTLSSSATAFSRSLIYQFFVSDWLGCTFTLWASIANRLKGGWNYKNQWIMTTLWEG